MTNFRVLELDVLTTSQLTTTRQGAVILKTTLEAGMCALAMATSIRAQGVVEAFGYASSEELTAAWVGSPNTVVIPSEAVSADSGGKTAIK